MSGESRTMSRLGEVPVLTIFLHLGNRWAKNVFFVAALTLEKTETTGKVLVVLVVKWETKKHGQDDPCVVKAWFFTGIEYNEFRICQEESSVIFVRLCQGCTGYGQLPPCGSADGVDYAAHRQECLCY